VVKPWFCDLQNQQLARARNSIEKRAPCSSAACYGGSHQSYQNIIEVHNRKEIARVRVTFWLLAFSASLACGVARMGQLKVRSSHIGTKQFVVCEHFCARFQIAPSFHVNTRLIPSSLEEGVHRSQRW